MNYQEMTEIVNDFCDLVIATTSPRDIVSVGCREGDPGETETTIEVTFSSLEALERFSYKEPLYKGLSIRKTVGSPFRAF